MLARRIVLKGIHMRGIMFVTIAVEIGLVVSVIGIGNDHMRWRSRRAQAGQSAVGSAGTEDAQEDAAER